MCNNKNDRDIDIRHKNAMVEGRNLGLVDSKCLIGTSGVALSHDHHIESNITAINKSNEIARAIFDKIKQDN